MGEGGRELGTLIFFGEFLWIYTKKHLRIFISCAGYEFDVGIHYIGEVNPGNLNRTFIDQITEGQLEWEPLNDIYDIVQIEYDEEKKRFVTFFLNFIFINIKF